MQKHMNWKIYIEWLKSYIKLRRTNPWWWYVTLKSRVMSLMNDLHPTSYSDPSWHKLLNVYLGWLNIYNWETKNQNGKTWLAKNVKCGTYEELNVLIRHLSVLNWIMSNVVLSSKMLLGWYTFYRMIHWLIGWPTNWLTWRIDCVWQDWLIVPLTN